ncbi:unnamed protein product [Durusdinium trenchii]|uniref:SET domain-containing protein n=1 Tax=Durusdinium trenchii TaxID=1381693 RepID=A0ABP0N0F7_9DINO
MAKHLPDQVADASGGRLRLVDTLDRGRSLEAAVDLPVGHRWRDTPVLPHGSNLGKYLIQACPDCEEDEHFSSDFVAALDFLASLLLQGCQSDVLSKLYSFTKEATEVPMIQHWHKRWRSDLTERITVAELEEAWIHVVPNWRQLKVSCPVVRRAAVNGVDVPLLSHDVVCGLWLQMALCEHSCDPNCSLVHDGEDLWFITVRPIPAGSAVTTSYLNMESLMKPTSLRREELREVWGFDCACSRCAKDQI